MAVILVYTGLVVALLRIPLWLVSCSWLDVGVAVGASVGGVILIVIVAVLVAVMVVCSRVKRGGKQSNVGVHSTVSVRT